MAGLFAKLSVSRSAVIDIANVDEALRDRPRGLFFCCPKRSAHVPDQYLDNGVVVDACSNM